MSIKLLNFFKKKNIWKELKEKNPEGILSLSPMG